MKKIIIAVVVIALIGLGWFLFKGGSSEHGQQVSTLDAIDTVGEFYDKWLKAEQVPTTVPDQATLATWPTLGKALSARLVAAQTNPNTTPDPVLCQTKTPEKITLMNVFVLEDKAQILVTSRDKKVTEQAIVSLTRLNDGWYISEIECTAGEFAPVREFSFEKEGYLIKGSIPKPFNPKNWHLVFEDEGTAGHVVPLFYDKDSQCTSLSGVKSVCKPDSFSETAKVMVHGQMTERGLIVKKQEFIN